LPLIVDFLNTVDERTFRRHGENHVRTDALSSPRALSQWLTAHDLAAPGTRVSAADLADAVALRTALRQALVDESGAAAALAHHSLQLVPEPPSGLRLVARSGAPWSRTLIETVATSAVRGDWARLKLCAAPDCRWAFHDTSRSGRGRWCEMDVCGNRHKTRAYRDRQHANASLA
jgi:predicted RNA-binding Zn ribbon-like protein